LYGSSNLDLNYHFSKHEIIDYIKQISTDTPDYQQWNNFLIRQKIPKDDFSVLIHLINYFEGKLSNYPDLILALFRNLKPPLTSINNFSEQEQLALNCRFDQLAAAYVQKRVTEPEILLALNNHFKDVIQQTNFTLQERLVCLRSLDKQEPIHLINNNKNIACKKQANKVKPAPEDLAFTISSKQLSRELLLIKDEQELNLLLDRIIQITDNQNSFCQECAQQIYLKYHSSDNPHWLEDDYLIARDTLSETVQRIYNRIYDVNHVNYQVLLGKNYHHDFQEQTINDANNYLKELLYNRKQLNSLTLASINDPTSSLLSRRERQLKTDSLINENNRIGQSPSLLTEDFRNYSKLDFPDIELEVTV
jgi:hypothetical protein